MLHLSSGVGVTRLCPEPLHPSVADPIQEDDKAFDKFGGGDVLPVGDGDPVPRPTKFREGAQKAGEGDESVTPENSALDQMRKADVDMSPSTSTGINDDAGQHLHEPSENQDPFHGGEDGRPDLPVPGSLFVHLGNNIVQRVVRMNGIVAGVISVSAGNRGRVGGGRLGGPVNRLGVVFLIEADSLGRGT